MNNNNFMWVFYWIYWDIMHSLSLYIYIYTIIYIYIHTHKICHITANQRYSPMWWCGTFTNINHDKDIYIYKDSTFEIIRVYKPTIWCMCIYIYTHIYTHVFFNMEKRKHRGLAKYDNPRLLRVTTGDAYDTLLRFKLPKYACFSVTPWS